MIHSSRKKFSRLVLILWPVTFTYVLSYITISLITLDSERVPSSFEKVTLIGVCSYGFNATWDRSYVLWMSLK